MFHKVYFGERMHYLGPIRILILMLLTKVQEFLIDMYLLHSDTTAFWYFSIVSRWHFNIYFNTDICAMGKFYQNDDLSLLGDNTYKLLKKRTTAIISSRCKKHRIVNGLLHNMFVCAGLDMRYGFYRNSEQVKRSYRNRQYAK